MVIGAVYVTMGQMIRLLQLYVDNLDILQMVGIYSIYNVAAILPTYTCIISSPGQLVLQYFDVKVPYIPILLDEVRCTTGTETSLLDCNNNGFYNQDCIHIEDVIVECAGMYH